MLNVRIAKKKRTFKTSISLYYLISLVDDKNKINFVSTLNNASYAVL